MFGFDTVIAVLKGINTGFEALGNLTKLGLNVLQKKNGSHLVQDLNKKDQSTGNIVNTTNIFVPSHEFLLAMANQMLRNPAHYEIERLDLVKGLSGDQLSRYYQPSKSTSTVIIPDQAGDYIIGQMPLPIARHAFLRGIQQEFDVSLLRSLGFQMYYYDISESKYILSLSEVEKLYFTQLYNDVVKLKYSVKSRHIKPFATFLDDLYLEKTRLETNEGWGRVIFELTTRQRGNETLVGTVPVRMMRKNMNRR